MGKAARHPGEAQSAEIYVCVAFTEFCGQASRPPGRYLMDFKSIISKRSFGCFKNIVHPKVWPSLRHSTQNCCK